MKLSLAYMNKLAGVLNSVSFWNINIFGFEQRFLKLYLHNTIMCNSFLMTNFRFVIIYTDLSQLRGAEEYCEDRILNWIWIN